MKQRLRDRKAEAAPELNTVTEAIRRDPHAVMPGEHHNQPHPVRVAAKLLLEFDELETEIDVKAYHSAGLNLRNYHESQVEALALATKRADLAERAHGSFAEQVALALDLDPEASTDVILANLRARLVAEPITVDGNTMDKAQLAELGSKPELRSPRTMSSEDTSEETKVLRMVLARIAKAADAPEWAHTASDRHSAETIGKAACDELENAEKMRATIKQQASQVAEASITYTELRQVLDILDREAGTIAFSDGQPDNPLTALQQLIGKLRENQKEPGWEQAVKVLVDSNKRYETVLATIQHAVSLA